MDTLPLELSMMIMEYLSVCDLVPCSQTSRAMRNLYRPVILDRLRKVPWQITIDFIRDEHHHIHVQYCWIKLGWFPKDIDKYGVTSMIDLYRKFRLERDSSLEHILLQLYECPDPSSIEYLNYVVVREGYGGPVLDSILRHGRYPRVRMSRGYVPFIYGLTDQSESDATCIIPKSEQTSLMLGCDRPLAKGEPLLTMGHTRIPIVEYNDDHILYRSFVIT